MNLKKKYYLILTGIALLFAVCVSLWGCREEDAGIPTLEAVVW